MASRSPRVPRAQIAVTVLSDPAFVALMSRRGKVGPTCFGVFCALVVAAKEQRNHGVFPSLELAANCVRVAPKLCADCVSILREVCTECAEEPWLFVDDAGRLVIRNFRKWNEFQNWGGKRSGAGRPSSDNQDDSLDSDLDCAPIRRVSFNSRSSLDQGERERSAESAPNVSARADREHETPQPPPSSATLNGYDAQPEDPRGISSSVRFSWQLRAQAVYDRLPQRFRRSFGRFRDAYAWAAEYHVEPDELDEIMLRRYAAIDAQSEPGFTPLPHTWLADMGWRDSPESWRRGDEPKRDIRDVFREISEEASGDESAHG